jgi:hypothetical protein
MLTTLGEYDMNPFGPTSTLKVAACPTPGIKAAVATHKALIRIPRFIDGLS